MERVEKNAKSLEAALELASESLGVPVGEISYEVVHEIGGGLLGFLVGGKEISISAWRTKDAPKEAPKPAPAKPAAAPAAAKFAPAPAKPVAPAKPIANNEPQKAAPPQSGSSPRGGYTAQYSSKPATAARPEPAKPVQQRPAAHSEPAKPHAERPEREVMVDIPDSAVADAKYFLDGLVEKMGLSAEITAAAVDGVVNLNVSGDKMGILIGKRGETLDSMQYLTSLYVNRAKGPYIKVKIDTENYRSKREETLVRLAMGIERRVMTERRSVTLEPMSPGERRIIHATLQRNPKIKTYSVGDEPHRKVVISYIR